jgi:hypothetical protein
MIQRRSRMLAVAGIALLAFCTEGVATPNDQTGPPPEPKRPAQGRDLPESKKGSKAKLPTAEALASASTVGGALALWGSFSPVLRERTRMAPRQAALQVVGMLHGTDITVENAKTYELRRIALAQIRGACAVFLTTPGIDFTTDERDLIAAYAARAGLLLDGEEKPRTLPRR